MGTIMSDHGAESSAGFEIASGWIWGQVPASTENNKENQNDRPHTGHLLIGQENAVAHLAALCSIQPVI